MGIKGQATYNSCGQTQNRDGYERKRDRTYARAVEKGSRKLNEKPIFVHLQFNVPQSKMVRFDKAYVGVVKKTGSTYGIQEALNSEGFFNIKGTPMGANL